MKNWIDERWNKNFELVVKYKDLYGEFPMCKTVFEGKAIGQWCAQQMYNYRNNLLDLEKIKQLNEIGFAWSMNQNQWNKMFDMCCEYINKFGEIPSIHVTYKGYRLGIWYYNQRKRFENNLLSDIEKNKLIEIDESINVSSSMRKELIWQMRFDTLCKYINEFGSFPNSRTLYDDFLIGKWCNRQKINYKKNKISDKCIEKLNSINFNFDK